MDKDSCHCLFYTCSHHANPDPRPHPLLSLPYETPPWPSDFTPALASGLHLCSIPCGACAAAAHYATVLHIQLHLQVCKHIWQRQEKELKTMQDQSYLVYSGFIRYCSTFLNVLFMHDVNKTYPVVLLDSNMKHSHTRAHTHFRPIKISVNCTQVM